MPTKPSVHRPPGFRSAAEVKQALDRERPSASRRGYGSRWRRARAAFLAQHALCAACRALGRVVPATVVDHVMPHRGDQKLFWDQGNWAPSCKPCHDAKTAREGRWGRCVSPRGEVICPENRPAGPVAPSRVYAREIQEGGLRPLFGRIPGFLL